MNTVYRTSSVVEDEPCGSCVRDVSKPNVRVGYPDPDALMMMRCDACGARWIDPTLAEQARETHYRLKEMAKQAETIERLADQLIKETFRTRRVTKMQLACMFVVGFIVSDIFIRIFLP